MMIVVLADSKRMGRCWLDCGGAALSLVLHAMWLGTRDADPRPLSTWVALSLTRMHCGETALRPLRR
jgi:hypothetical protein